MGQEETRVEVKFLVPITEDKKIGNGKTHPFGRWQKLQELLIKEYPGWSKTPGHYEGEWIDGEGNIVKDTSQEYIVDILEEEKNRMTETIKVVSKLFRQECIRTVYQGKARLVGQKKSVEKLPENMFYRTLDNNSFALDDLSPEHRVFVEDLIAYFNQNPNWPDFGNYWIEKLIMKFDFEKVMSLPIFKICQDLESRIGIKQECIKKPRDMREDFIVGDIA